MSASLPGPPVSGSPWTANLLKVKALVDLDLA